MQINPVAVVVVVAACGRVGFDPVGDGRIDAAIGDGDAPAPMCAAVATADWLGAAVPNDPGSGLPHAELYAANADLVADEVTGLVWQRAPAPDLIAWSQASAYCTTLSLDGCTSWRLPHRVELATLVDHAFASPVIDPNAFPGTPVDTPFWSATPHTSAGNSWVVNFDNGNSFWSPTTDSYHVRCVTGGRGPDTPPARYQVSSTTVLDVDTGLTWQRAPSPALVPQATAVAQCVSAGFRLPSIRELWTLLDTSLTPQPYDMTAFPSIPLGTPYWSASPFGVDFMTISFDDGSTVNAQPSTNLFAWCVK